MKPATCLLAGVCVINRLIVVLIVENTDGFLGIGGTIVLLVRNDAFDVLIESDLYVFP